MCIRNCTTRASYSQSFFWWRPNRMLPHSRGLVCGRCWGLIKFDEQQIRVHAVISARPRCSLSMWSFIYQISALFGQTNGIVSSLYINQDSQLGCLWPCKLMYVTTATKSPITKTGIVKLAHGQNVSNLFASCGYPLFLNILFWYNLPSIF